jgi:ADP-ribosylglycohydrolase
MTEPAGVLDHDAPEGSGGTHSLNAGRAAGALVGAAMLAGLPRDGAPPGPVSRLPALIALLAEHLRQRRDRVDPFDDLVYAHEVADAVRTRAHLDWPEQDHAFASNLDGEPAGSPGWDEASAAARCVAVGLLPATTAAGAAALARRTAGVTHSAAAAQSAAAVHAVAVQHLVRGGDASADVLLPAVRSVVDDELGVRLALVGDLVQGEDLDASDTGSLRLGGFPWIRASLATQEWVGTASAEAVPAAMYAFLRHPDDWRRARRTALALVDPEESSTAAVRVLGALVGALVGAHVGARSLDLGSGGAVPRLVVLGEQLVAG